MRILEGVGTPVQLGGLMARLCKVVRYLIGRFLLATAWLMSLEPCRG